MPTSGEIIRGLDNVQVFKELATLHSQGLVRDGITWTEPIPVWLRPYTEVSRGYPWNRVVRADYIQGVAKAKAINEEDTAPLGSRDIYGVEMLEPLHSAGHSMQVTQATLREAMAQDRLAQMVTQPSEEWFRAAQELMMDVATAGAFSNGSANPTDDFAPSIIGFDGVTYTQRKATNSANTASATIANSSHSVQWATRAGGLFAANHDHVSASSGGAWTRARGRAQQLLIYEHPRQNGVDAFVGTTVRDAILDAKENWRGSSSGVGQTPLLTDFVEGGMRDFQKSDFGMPEFIGDVDGVRYFYLKDLTADLQVSMLRGGTPLRAFVGVKGEADAPVEPPFAWTDELPRELRGPQGNAGIKYGYRGYFGGQCQSPIAAAVAKHV